MRYAVALLVVLLAACGDSNGPQLQPASFAVVDGIGQVDTVGRELKDMIALRVIATDGATSVPNYPINWTALDGGQVFATVAYSGTDGVARQRWTLGPGAGAQRLVARALDPETGGILVDDTVTAEATPDVAVAFSAFPTGAGASGAVADTIAATDSGAVVWFFLRDAHNNAGATCPGGIGLTWASEDSTIAVPTGQVTEDEQARTYGWVRGVSAGETRIVVSAGCVGSPPAEIGVIVTP